ncbi:MAG: amidophosphoribosyltransferase [Pseudomonadales bacterium]|jgi:amidophosphoribosyltransferase|nr:amidophosphoribosyltransferase [Pseudomonadales bacterium]MDP6826103.1 amidophosphoribosyltransferase [Pseudomonadales bacterium]MDP6971521.1 amidophosphoribosyltransferase [Pseudomonadales bacterium]
MCGIVGIVSHEAANQQIYDALTVLQHRGQDAAGMVTSDDNKLHLRKANGLVREVFQQNHIDRLVGNMGIGHVRYPTAGSSSSAEAQPMYVNSPYGITLAHNGNLTNADALQADLFREDLRHVNTSSDSEVLLNVLAHELQLVHAHRPDENDVFEAIEGLHRRCRGAYAAVALIIGIGVVGFRDPYGIRPLVYGRRESETGFEYMIASESVALDLLGFELIGDVAPGEAVFITRDGQLHRRVCADRSELTPCIFEHVYLARPDSIMDEISVYKARLRQGEFLADAILGRYAGNDHDIDVVIPIPDTGRTAAIPLAHRLNVKYREGFIKNRYIGRTFIMPGQHQRRQSVRHKHNAIDLEFRGKNVLLVDDSVVRGTTIGQIIQMARDAGARKVYLASCAPAIRHPNVYGIDMPAAAELAAHGHTEEEVGHVIGADWLVYQKLEDLIKSGTEGNPAISRFECSVFDGDYVTGDIDAEYLKRLSLTRNDKAKQRRETELRADSTVIELHNHP